MLLASAQTEKCTQLDVCVLIVRNMITVSPDVILCGRLGSKHQQRKNMITAGSFIIIPRRFSHIPAACADIGVLPVNLQNVHPPFVAGQVSTPLSKHVGHVN